MLRVVARLVAVAVKRRPIIRAASDAMLEHARLSEDGAAALAQNHLVVQLLAWLETNAVPEKVFRIANFVVFVIFSAIQLLTS